MPVIKQDLMDTVPEEVFDWEVDNLEAGLSELGVIIGTKWSKSKKAMEFNRAISQQEPKDVKPSKPKDPTVMMMKALQAMQRQVALSEERAIQVE